MKRGRWSWPYICSFVALAALAVQASAQCRTIGRRVVQCDVQQVAVQQVVAVQNLVPVLVAQPVFANPLVSYLHAGGSYYPNQYQQQQLIQPPATPRAAQPCPQIDEGALVERIIGKLEAKAEKQSRPAPPPVPGFKRAEVKPVSFAPKSDRTYLDVLAQNCSECHSQSAHKGGVALFDVQGNMAPNVNFNAVWLAISEGRMPPANKARISDPDIKILMKAFGLDRS